MQWEYFATHFGLTALLAFAVTGCTMREQVPLDRLKDYSLLVPRQENSIVSKVDDKVGTSMAGTMANILPGHHRIETNSCTGGPGTCWKNLYVFDAQPGLAYVFRSPSIVEVYDRFELDKHKLGLLHDSGNGSREFVDDQEYAALQQRLAQRSTEIAQRAEALRRQNLPLIRKIGARICQSRGDGFVYVGYVEGLADEKVQIRVAEAHVSWNPNMHPGNFSPSIIWDSPMQWNLCE